MSETSRRGEGLTVPMVAKRERKRPIEIDQRTVDVAGVKIERGAEAGPRVPPAKNFINFCEDEFSVNLLQIIAKSAALDQPLLLEGEAAVGKSHTIEYLAHLCNREVYRMSLNGQTDTADLIGKWVPRTDTVRKRIETLLRNPEVCASEEAKRLITQKTRIAKAQGEEIAPESAQASCGLTKEEMETIATLEGIEVPEGDWVWQDGDIPKQMKTGAWSVLDEVNTCEPQILVRLNALLERGGQLVLSEDGSKVVDRHKDFRLFATVNPPGGRFKGRIPLSAEWISRWNYQNVGDLPKAVRAARLMAAEGVPVGEVKIEKLNLAGSDEITEGKNLADFYGVDWVRDLFTKYAEFVESVREMLSNGEIARDQTQVFDFDPRDDWRFREYIRKFHESGNIIKTIKDAIWYCFASKCKKKQDRKKIMDKVSLIQVSEPQSADAEAEKRKAEEEARRKAKADAEREKREREEFEARLKAIKAKLAGMDLPPKHRMILLGAESGEGAEVPPECLEALKEIFSGETMEAIAMPKPEELTPEYFDRWYPAAEREEDRDRGLISFRPYWWNILAPNAMVGDADETWGEAFVRSMIAEAERLRGVTCFTESLQKPNHFDGGSQLYGTKEGREVAKDPLRPIIQEVFGRDANRFNLTWNQIQTELIPKVEEIITTSLRSKGISSIPKFEVIITPALVGNRQMTECHPENSQTNTCEWSSTPLLKQDNSDSGYRLVVGGSGRGGASCVINGDRERIWSYRGFRLSVVFKT